MKIFVAPKVSAPITLVWRGFSDAEDILQGDTSDDWHTSKALNDLKVTGLHIDARNGKSEFNFAVLNTKADGCATLVCHAAVPQGYGRFQAISPLQQVDVMRRLFRG